MRLDNRIILIAIAVLTLGLIPVALFTSGPPRIILSFLCLIFFPGYTLMSALFPKQGDIGVIERIALSFGASIAVVAIIGFMLNFTPWGIRLIPVVLSVGAFIMCTAAIGFIREQVLPDEMRFYISLETRWEGWYGMTLAKKLVLIAGLLAAFVGAGSLIYFEVALPVKPVPSEFYILNSQGNAENYPRQVTAGDNVVITAVVINHESQPTAYVIRATNDGNVIGESSTGGIAREEKWEGKVSFIVAKAGSAQKIDFYLYKDGEGQPYFKEPLYIYVDTLE